MDDPNSVPIQRSEDCGFLVVKAVYAGTVFEARMTPCRDRDGAYALLEQCMKANLAYEMGVPVGFVYSPVLWVRGAGGTPIPF